MSSGATGTSAHLESDTETDTKTDAIANATPDAKGKAPKDKPKLAKKPRPKSSEEEGDPSEKPPLLGNEETEVVQPGKTGLPHSGQGDSQA